MSYSYDRRTARLPGKAYWRPGNNGEQRTSVVTPSGEWILRVLPFDGGPQHELRLLDPKKVEYVWNSKFKKKDLAIKEAELVASSIKKRDKISFAGWKKVASPSES